jgi:hypothetical protein
VEVTTGASEGVPHTVNVDAVCAVVAQSEIDE